MSAEFDTADHRSLITVLENMYGTSWQGLEWFKDYLRNRSLQVLVGNCVFEVLSLPFSVPLGIMFRTWVI